MKVGFPFEITNLRYATEPIDRYQRPYEGITASKSAMQTYLDWEYGLVRERDRDGSAPHSVANSGLTLSDWHGFYGSLRYRHISGYILDGEDPRNPIKQATGLVVLDLNTSKQIRQGARNRPSISVGHLAAHYRGQEPARAGTARCRPAKTAFSYILLQPDGTPLRHRKA